MTGEKWYRVNKPNVIEEVLEGEAVIVNLATGSYYSTDHSGAAIWSLLVQGTTLVEIIEHLGRHYTELPSDVEKLVKQWLDVMEEESLVVAEPFEGAATNPGLTGVAAEEGQLKTRFTEPKIEKYTEMEDLLLLDPIHDANETGWPGTSEEPAN
jgi:Coenzyme PQQ synthesis protein D (PqqD)